MGVVDRDTIGRPAAWRCNASTAQRSSPAGEPPTGWSGGSTWDSPPSGRPAVAAFAVALQTARRSWSSALDTLSEQSALPDAGGPAEDEAATGGPLAASVKRASSTVSPDKTPGGHRRSISTAWLLCAPAKGRQLE